MLVNLMGDVPIMFLPNPHQKIIQPFLKEIETDD